MPVNCVRIYANVALIERAKKVLAALDEEFSFKASAYDNLISKIELQTLYVLREFGKMCPVDLSDITGVSVDDAQTVLENMHVSKLVHVTKSPITIFYNLSPTRLDWINSLLPRPLKQSKGVVLN